MADLGLCYYIHGKRTALSVCVSSNETILFLKRKIYDEVSLPANMGSPTLVDTTGASYAPFPCSGHLTNTRTSPTG